MHQRAAGGQHRVEDEDLPGRPASPGGRPCRPPAGRSPRCGPGRRSPSATRAASGARCPPCRAGPQHRHDHGGAAAVARRVPSPASGSAPPATRELARGLVDQHLGEFAQRRPEAALSVRSSRIRDRRARASGWSTTVSCTRDTVAAARAQGRTARYARTPHPAHALREAGDVPTDRGIRRRTQEKRPSRGAMRISVPSGRQVRHRPSGCRSTRNPWWTLVWCCSHSSAAVLQRGLAAVDPVQQVVDVAPMTGGVAAGEHAVPVAGLDCPAQVGWDSRWVRPRSSGWPSGPMTMRVTLPPQASQRALAAEMTPPNPVGRRRPGGGVHQVLEVDQ